MLETILHLAAGVAFLAFLFFFCVAAVAINRAEHNRRDFDRRHQARADAHEALARNADEIRARRALFPSAGRVENKSYLRRRAS